MSRSERIFSTLFGGQLLSRDMAAKQALFVLYLFLLVILYISIHNGIEKTRLTNYSLEGELKALHSEYISKNAELMNLSQRHMVTTSLQDKASSLRAPLNPPYWIQYGTETGK